MYLQFRDHVSRNALIIKKEYVIAIKNLIQVYNILQNQNIIFRIISFFNFGMSIYIL